MKTVLISDLHGRSTWKLIVNIEKPDRVIFIGDYFDSFDITTEEQINNFLDIIAYKESGICEVVLLVGNHCLHYITGDNGTSGYQQIGSLLIEPIIKKNLHHLQMAYQFDNYLCTHAGVSEIFMDECFGKDGWKIETIVDDLNDLFLYKPKSFEFNGYMSRTGDEIGQTPVWIRPYSLMKDSFNINKAGINQIVGHTTMKKMDLENYIKSGYFYTDTLGTSGEYLIIEDNKIRIGKV